MSLKTELGPQLPYLRRYARALTGSQSLGDAAVRHMLAGLLAGVDQADGEHVDADRPPRLELFRLFDHSLSMDGGNAGSASPVAGLAVPMRKALLLTAIEGFSNAEAAIILGRSAPEITADIASARQAIANCLLSQVMIIEDEAIIALHIQSIVEDLGHEVLGIARTRAEAFALAGRTRPELVLADISLADGSSGIDAVADILAQIDVPVIFITAFPERLLTGQRPEPAYLVAKPFSPETLTATIGQALLFHRELAAG